MAVGATGMAVAVFTGVDVGGAGVLVGFTTVGKTGTAVAVGGSLVGEGTAVVAGEVNVGEAATTEVGAAVVGAAVVGAEGTGEPISVCWLTSLFTAGVAVAAAWFAFGIRLTHPASSKELISKNIPTPASLLNAIPPQWIIVGYYITFLSQSKVKRVGGKSPKHYLSAIGTVLAIVHVRNG